MFVLSARAHSPNQSSFSPRWNPRTLSRKMKMHCQRQKEGGNDGASDVGSTGRGKEGSVKVVKGMSGPVACQKGVGLMNT